MTAATAQVVTPSNSNDFHEKDNNYWLHKLESGQALLSEDWELLSQTKTQIPWLHQVIENNNNNDVDVDRERHAQINQRLVRMVGLVQDQLDVEFFLAHEQQQLQDRTPVVLTPLPNCTRWFRDAMLLLDEKEEEGEEEEDRRRPSKRVKRSNSNNNNNNDDVEQDDTTSCDENSSIKTQQQQPVVIANFYYDQYQYQRHHHPKEERKLRLNEIVQVIGVLETTETLQMDQQQPQLSSSYSSSQDSSMITDEDWVAPPHLPRLHVVWYQPVDLDQLTASASAATATTSVGPSATVPASSTTTATATAMSPASHILARSLSMSDTCAEALWMVLMSMAERKQEFNSIAQESTDAFCSSSSSSLFNYWTPVETPQETLLGCASLNLILPNSEACSKMQALLQQVLSNVLPQVVTVTLGVGGGDGGGGGLVMLPYKRLSRLHTSVLQLPKGSTLILNVADQLSCAGATSVLQQARLQELTSSHRLSYTFEGVPILFEADYRIVVLSTPTTQHVLPCTLQCQHQQQEAVVKPDHHLGSSSIGASSAEEQDAYCYADLAVLRSALARARGGGGDCGTTSINGSSNIAFSPEVLERAQQDFIERRSQARREREGVQQAQQQPLVNETDFHRWLTLTRLQARSRQASTAEVQDWQRALALDDAMLASLHH